MGAFESKAKICTSLNVFELSNIKPLKIPDMLLQEARNQNEKINLYIGQTEYKLHRGNLISFYSWENDVCTNLYIYNNMLVIRKIVLRPRSIEWYYFDENEKKRTFIKVLIDNKDSKPIYYFYFKYQTICHKEKQFSFIKYGKTNNKLINFTQMLKLARYKRPNILCYSYYKIYDLKYRNNPLFDRNVFKYIFKY